MINIDEEKLVFLSGYISELYGIELLEYHNKNHLSGDNKTRSENKLALLNGCISILKGIEQGQT